VADEFNHRIQKFTSSGTFITKWGSLGSGDGQFELPRAVAVDGQGNVYVADSGNHRIQKFTSDGAFLTKWGGFGSGDGQFIRPPGVAADGQGNVYVADANNNRIQKFTSTGTFLLKWGSGGSGDGQFNVPFRVAMDGQGNVYVADVGNHRIQKFTSQGVFLTKWGGFGSGDGQFNDPEGVAVDGQGNVYVADTLNARIQKFTSQGAFITKWGSQGNSDGQFVVPFGVAVDGQGNVNVADGGNHRIQKFSPPSPGTFTVNSIGDGADSNTADGVCKDGTGACTLRAAIQQANASAGKNTIAFNISGAGPHTIRPNSALPTITDPVIIDGYTQPGSSPNTNPVGQGLNTVLRIELDGSNSGPSIDGLVLSAGNSMVRGLVINRFPGEGIVIFSNGGNVIEGNFIGIDPTGRNLRGNLAGVIVISTNNVIGGSTAGARNLITAGTDLNQGSAVFIKGSVSDNLIQGNLIGTDVSGVNPLGNFDFGVLITGSRNSILDNTIAFSKGTGIFVHSGDRNSILGNSIHSNGGLGIDLGGDFITANDAGDADTGANNLQNFPVLTLAVTTTEQTQIGGALNSTPSTQFKSEFFFNTSCDPSGHGEGESRVVAFGLNPITVTTDGGGNITFGLSTSATVPVGRFVTATATDPNGNTSEFSQCKVVVASSALTGSISGTVTLQGRTATVTLQGRTATFPTGVGHGIATVTLNPSGVSASVGADGSFQISSVPPGTFTLTASASGYVSRQRTNVVVAASPVTLPSTQLRCGLVNDDNFVNINDITATVASFGTSPANRVDAQGRFVDQNGDGFVNINDITCVVSGFGVTSPLPWE
jgi:CSLREA domain-containing protein